MATNGKPLSTRDEIMEVLMRYSREPFMQALAEVMECRPDKEDLMRFASKSPDRFFQAVAILARLSGFTEKLEVTHNIHARVSTMSDAELDAELEALVIDVDSEVVHVQPPADRTSDS